MVIEDYLNKLNGPGWLELINKNDTKWDYDAYPILPRPNTWPETNKPFDILIYILDYLKINLNLKGESVLKSIKILSIVDCVHPGSGSQYNIELYTSNGFKLGGNIQIREGSLPC